MHTHEQPAKFLMQHSVTKRNVQLKEGNLYAKFLRKSFELFPMKLLKDFKSISAEALPVKLRPKV